VLCDVRGGFVMQALCYKKRAAPPPIFLMKGTLAFAYVFAKTVVKMPLQRPLTERRA
jgi:hypothetical protein